MRIDAHQHFWSVARGDYGWLTPEVGSIYRDFGPEDLSPLLKASGIDGTVLVQAAPTVAETEFMLGIADTNPFVLGVVGWVDFQSAGAADIIGRLARHPKLVGLRPMIQDIADTDWMLGDDLGAAFKALTSHDLVFDALTLPKHLGNLAQLLERYPEMRVVVDHGSKPFIRDGILEPWATDITRIAKNSEAYCKLSGLVTEASGEWTAEDLKPYVEHLLDVFGPERLIWGSDWPVCTLASSYERWVSTTDTLLAGLSAPEREAVLGGNAARLYKL